MPGKSNPYLSDQCVAVGWPLEQLTVLRTPQKQWRLGAVETSDPEAIAALYIASLGESCSWCEGATINLLIKAAALDTLARLNSFDDRVDAVRRYLGAQFTILASNISEVFSTIATSDQAVVERNLREVLGDPFVQDAYPRVQLSFALELLRAIDRSKLLEIAQRLAMKPYEYRSGWPDLTVIGGNGVRFVEVKTTDRFQASQLRFATEVAEPLGLRCSVLQVIPARNGDHAEA
ncbi:VRR-NUC domain-containing protein [Methylovorus mays]|uniref:VRR-NUC domain-containing protein n=1 Tax=Methylovorus mays TaxID=184077 RepID=UPI001E479A6A|nr:VRR-NUC domain-containing protein [Methylovorus mays]MCB5207801.1 VRR-NUC domain-containing protein [Methylovorus mays]